MAMDVNTLEAVYDKLAQTALGAECYAQHVERGARSAEQAASADGVACGLSVAAECVMRLLEEAAVDQLRQDIGQ